MKYFYEEVDFVCIYIDIKCFSSSCSVEGEDVRIVTLSSRSAIKTDKVARWTSTTPPSSIATIESIYFSWHTTLMIMRGNR